jgi:hypothetical protein
VNLQATHLQHYCPTHVYRILGTAHRHVSFSSTSLSINQGALPIKNIILAFVPHKITGHQQRTNHQDRDPFLDKNQAQTWIKTKSVYHKTLSGYKLVREFHKTYKKTELLGEFVFSEVLCCQIYPERPRQD